MSSSAVEHERVFFDNLPIWAWVLMAVGAGAVVIVILIAVVLVCFSKKKKKLGESGKNGKVDVKAVKALGQSYKEKVQPDLEELIVGRSSKEEEKDKGLGKIHYSVDYNYKSHQVSIAVIECADLPAMDSGNTSDPFVRFFLHPDMKSYETKVIGKSLDPIFNENFAISISYPDLVGSNLFFEIYDYDRLSRHDQIGKVLLPLNTIDLGEMTDRWSYIQPPDSESKRESRPGDLCFTLRYAPTAAKLTIVIIEAKNLRKMDSVGLSDPYVRISLMVGNKRIKKKQTSVKKKTLSPYYNESFDFEVPFEKIQNMSMFLEVVDYDLIGKSDVVGQVTLGCNTIGQSLRHWSEMLANPRRAIAQWHGLQEPQKEE